MFNPLNKPTTTSNVIKHFVRGKRQATELNIATQKIVNQLSVLSASRKQPKLLKLCNEDFIKHKTIMNAWKLLQRRRITQQSEKLSKQYKSIVNAMEDLKQTSPELFEAANAKNPKRFTTFPIEMRVPTEYPPNKPWTYNFVPSRTHH